MKKLFEGVFDIDAVVTKGKNEVDDILKHSLTVRLSGVFKREQLAFLFGVHSPEKNTSFAKVESLVPGFWDEHGAPVDADASFKPSSSFEGCTITVVEKIGGAPSNREQIAKFTDSNIKAFTLHPGYGNTFYVTFSFFTQDIDDDGADIGRMAVHTKREVFVKIDRPNDLFDVQVQESDEEDGGAE
jgi:hypothetical protein